MGIVNNSRTVTSGIIWKLLERFSVQGSQFIIQVILARLLSPVHYGALALMMIFVNIANVIIQNGFNTSLIQNRQADDEDYSSVFWLVLAMAVIIYSGLYIATPYLTSYYNMPYLEQPFKVLCLMLIPGALNSVQLAIIRRSMDFKKEFKSNFLSIIIAGSFGIGLAYLGYGLWSLVVQSFLNTVIACITMWRVVGWRPALVFNYPKVKKLFKFGYKLVLAGLLDTFSNDLSAFIIGAKYNALSLGFYTRGKQFPSAIMGSLNSAVQSVMLPALSAVQDSNEDAKRLMRKSMVLSAFFVFPIMACLAGVAKPMVQLVLTEKWLPCVPYIQIFCFSYAFWPVHTSNLQAINAMGRSDIFLRLEIYKKLISWTSLAVIVFIFDNPIAIAASSMVMTVISCFINCYPNKYLLNYSYLEQTKDILPYFNLSFIIFIILIAVENIFPNPFVTLMFQCLVAVCLYWMCCHFLKLSAYISLTKKIRELIKQVI